MCKVYEGRIFYPVHDVRRSNWSMCSKTVDWTDISLSVRVPDEIYSVEFPRRNSGGGEARIDEFLSEFDVSMKRIRL